MARQRYTQTRHPGRDDDATVNAAFINDMIEGNIPASNYVPTVRQLGTRQVDVPSGTEDGRVVMVRMSVPVFKLDRVDFDERAAAAEPAARVAPLRR